MNEQNTLRTEPAPEAYPRVTDPDRFLPLHGLALDLAARPSTVAGEGAWLAHVLGDVVAGDFREEFATPLFGAARLRCALGDGAARAAHPRGRHRGGIRTLPRDQARALRGRGPNRTRWQPRPAHAPSGPLS